MPIWKSFVSILLFVSSMSYASSWPIALCGDAPYYEELYYPIIDQKIIKDASLYPFLNCPYQPFCDYPGTNTAVEENISDWQQFFGESLSDEVVYQLVYTEPEEWYTMLEAEDLRVLGGDLAKSIPENLQKSFASYMILAKKCEGISSNAEGSTGWYQGEYKEEEDEKSDLLELALKNYHAETNTFLKNRYGYQIVRLAHYLQENKEAVHYFDNFLSLDPSTPYIYYLALEQRSGAAFNLGGMAEATKGFLEVYAKAPSRREVCALSLKYIDWSNPQLGNDFFAVNGYGDIYSFFKAYYLNGSVAREMQNLQIENPNSAYLEILAMREIDALQNELFDNDYYDWNDDSDKEQELDSESLRVLQEIAKVQVEDKNVLRKDFWQIILSATYLKNKAYKIAAQQVSKVPKTSDLYAQAEHLSFAIEILELKGINRQEINRLFLKLKGTPELYQYSPVRAFFFNAVADLYEADGNVILSHLGKIYYHGELSVNEDDEQEMSTSWDIIESNIGTNWKLNYKNNYVEEEIVLKLQDFVDLLDKTPYEKLLASKLNSSPQDYANELQGTWHFQNNQLEKAISYFKKIENPSAFYGDYIRPEMFSGAIQEQFNISFGDQSDKIHLKYKHLFSEHLEKDRGEVYPDNKLKLAKYFLKLEELAETDLKNAADYYYMLGNARYNTSLPGWFLNTLHYIGNNSRNQVLNTSYYPRGKKKTHNPAQIEITNTYFRQAIAANGDKETKAKATFMLAKTNYCFTEQVTDSRNYKVAVCGDHRKYFQSLEEDYSDTDFQEQVIEECSWYRSYLNM